MRSFFNSLKKIKFKKKDPDIFDRDFISKQIVDENVPVSKRKVFFREPEPDLSGLPPIPKPSPLASLDKIDNSEPVIKRPAENRKPSVFALALEEKLKEEKDEKKREEESDGNGFY